MNKFPQLVGACELFLENEGYNSASHVVKTEEAMRQMYEYLKRYFEPPTLGIHVQETISVKDKAA